MDDLLKEIRAVRESYAERFGFDLYAIHHALKEQERVGKRTVVKLPPRRPTGVHRTATAVPASS